MFYFSIISSGEEIREAKEKAKNMLSFSVKTIENLVYWENTYNRELGNDEQAEHQDLLDCIQKLLSE